MLKCLQFTGIYATIHVLCRCGGIGRRAGLKIRWANNPYRFDSDHRHHNRGIRTPRKRNRVFGFYFFCAVFVLATVAVGVIGENQIQKQFVLLSAKMYSLTAFPREGAAAYLFNTYCTSSKSESSIMRGIPPPKNLHFDAVIAIPRLTFCDSSAM